MSPRSPDKGTPIVGAALASSLGIYFPIPLLRGAVFGLFPGLAHRSLREAAKGAMVGALCELVYTVVWVMLISREWLRMYWEPRSNYNKFLSLWLPGRLSVATHMGSPWPNSVQFWLGVLVWFMLMVFCWWVIWRPRLPVRRLLRAWAVTGPSVTTACGILWLVSPKDRWWPYAHGSMGLELEGVAWLIVFLSVLPICGLLIAYSFKVGRG